MTQVGISLALSKSAVRSPMTGVSSRGLSRRPSCRLWEVSAFSGQLSARDIADNPLRFVDCQRGRAWTEN